MFQKGLLLSEAERELEDLLEVAQPFFASMDSLTLLLYVTHPIPLQFHPNLWEKMERLLEEKEAALRTLEKNTTLPLPALEVRLTIELSSEVLVESCNELGVDLVMVAPLSPLNLSHPLPWLTEVAQEADLAVAWLPSSQFEPSHPPRPSSFQRQMILGKGELREHGGLIRRLRKDKTEDLHLLLASLTEVSPAFAQEDLSELAEMLGIRASVSLLSLQGLDLQIFEQVRELLVSEDMDLLWVPLEEVQYSVLQLPLLSQLLIGQLDVPVLFVPFEPSKTPFRPTLSAGDVLYSDKTATLLYVEQKQPWELFASPWEGTLHPVKKGETLASIRCEKGIGELESQTHEESEESRILGLGVNWKDSELEVELPVRVLFPESRILCLVDSSLSQEGVDTLKAMSRPPNALVVFVRLRRQTSLAELQKRFQDWGRDAAIVDASQLLNDGNPSDLPPGTESLRLYRIALRLRSRGMHVSSILAKRSYFEDDKGFSIVTEEEFLDAGVSVETLFASHPPKHSVSTGRFVEFAEAFLGAECAGGNKLQLQTDNQQAREHLLELFQKARETIHIQVYIVLDDTVTRQFETALKEAAARGVKVRMLVDSLYSMHGSFLLENQWIRRMEKVEGVELRLFRPIEGLPNLKTLKQRDHRKFVVVDNRWATVTGRNMAFPYYTDFSEVSLSPSTKEEEVPWMDTGVALEGTMAATINKSFLESWKQAGGEAFTLSDAVSAGDTECCFLQHHGLRDTYTLDAQLEMIRRAENHLYLINAFPLLREFQHAVLQAIRRGVKVRILIGNVRPLYKTSEWQSFQGNPLRDLAMQVIYSRLDVLLEAGAELAELLVPSQEPWDPEILEVRPYVHSKVMSCDGKVAAIGSANFDVTGAFWESEAMLVVEDAEFVGVLEAYLEQEIQRSLAISTDDEGWKDKASRRLLLDRYWPGLIA